MSISDAQFLTWLQRPGNFRGVLVEASYLNAGVAGTAYLANFGFASSSTSTPANTPYDELLDDLPGFSRRMSEAFSGRSSVSRGDVVVLNNGQFDVWMDYHWPGQSLRLYLGDPAWDRDDFRLIVDGVCAGMSVQGAKMALKLRDKGELLNTPFPRGTVVGGANAGKSLPLCFGECFNVEPLLIDASAHKYQVHDGAIEAITDVRGGGLTIGYTPDLPNGTFVLTAAPAGRVTCDVKGAKPVTYLSTAVDVAREILTAYGGIAPGDINETALGALDVAAPYDVGLYVIDDGHTMIAALDSVLGAINAYWLFGRLGRFTAGRLTVPTGSPDHTLVADDISEDGLTVKRQIKPQTSVKIGYRRNWSPQTDGLFTSVTESNRDLYGRDYTLAIDEDLTILTSYPDAPAGEEINTLLVNLVDAQAEATRRLAQVIVPRNIYEVDGFTAPYVINLGDEVSVSYPGLGFESGVDAMVVGLTDYPDQGRSIVEVWR